MNKAKADWSTPDDLRNRLRREWDKGNILAAMLGEKSVFPFRFSLKKPDTPALSEHFATARQWIADWVAASSPGSFELEWREFTHRQLGRNRIPVVATVVSEKEALTLLGKAREAAKFRSLSNSLLQSYPQLLPWLRKYPLLVLEQAEHWPRLLAVLDWMQANPRPAIYLRQIALTGIDSKFIESHRGLLGEMLDLVLPPHEIDFQCGGINGFERRYGFSTKPLLVRFRVLDQNLRIQGLTDLTVSSSEFAQLDLPAKRIFITENEINFLSFPSVPDSLVIFGSGYGFDHLAQAEWLHSREIYYWGDIDSHGFAILDQLRNKFPAVHSLLMDRSTLFEHQVFWGSEDRPTHRQLTRLSSEEIELYDELRQDVIAPALRLEQERLSFSWVEAALAKLLSSSS